MERLSGQIVKVSNEKDQLGGDSSRLTVQLQQCERELRQASDTLSLVKGEKDQLESALYEAHQLLGRREVLTHTIAICILKR